MTISSTGLVPAEQVGTASPAPDLPRGAVPCLTHPSPQWAAELIALAWLPALIVAAGLPWFVPVYARWNSGLPPLTEALLAVGRLGFWPIVLAGVALVAFIAAIGYGWARAGLPYHRAVVFALTVAGLGVFAAGLAGTLEPLLTFRIQYARPHRNPSRAVGGLG